MREIEIQTTTTDNHKRKNLLITETIDQQGFSAKAEKKYSYYVSERPSKILDPLKLKEWMDGQVRLQQKRPRHVSIRKIFDGKTGAGQMIYRVIGSFYVVQNLHLFAVVFMHSIKFDMLANHLPHPKF
jgi:hypothetical protein